MELAQNEENPAIYQIEWLQSRFESRGLKDYYFMKGGAQAYVEMKGKTTTAQAK